MPDVSNVREDGQFPPTFDDVAIVSGDRVQQPGVLIRDPRAYPQTIEREKHQEYAPITDRASDKFAVVCLNADQGRAYQLLPAEYNRKTGLIMCFGNAIMIGDVSSISNQIGTTATGTVPLPGIFLLPASNLSTGVAFALKYTSKQSLYVCSASTSTPAVVQCIVERYDSGVPIT
jgi:hypothetical protein